jgi:hypothetical protein
MPNAARVATNTLLDKIERTRIPLDTNVAVYRLCRHLPASPCSRFVTSYHLISHRHVNVRSTSGDASLISGSDPSVGCGTSFPRAPPPCRLTLTSAQRDPTKKNANRASP